MPSKLPDIRQYWWIVVLFLGVVLWGAVRQNPMLPIYFLAGVGAGVLFRLFSRR